MRREPPVHRAAVDDGRGLHLAGQEGHNGAMGFHLRRAKAEDLRPRLTEHVTGWIGAHRRPFHDHTVGSLVPVAFERYARVLHPAWAPPVAGMAAPAALGLRRNLVEPDGSRARPMGAPVGPSGRGRSDPRRSPLLPTREACRQRAWRHCAPSSPPTRRPPRTASSPSGRGSGGRSRGGPVLTCSTSRTAPSTSGGDRSRSLSRSAGRSRPAGSGSSRRRSSGRQTAHGSLRPTRTSTQPTSGDQLRWSSAVITHPDLESWPVGTSDDISAASDSINL